MRARAGTGNVLVVAAHPDDEVLGCGATMARLAEEGRRVSIAILGEGVTSRYSQRERADRDLLLSLRAKSRKAARLVGAREPLFFGLPDNRFDTVALLDIVKIVEGLVAKLRPETIYTHHGGDLNVDHALTFRAVLTATRPIAGSCAKEVYSFEIPSSTEWAFQKLNPPFQPNVFVDVGSTLERKIRAMEAYDSEMRPFPHPRSSEALRACAQRWGSAAGVAAAEAFELVRAVR